MQLIRKIIVVFLVGGLLISCEKDEVNSTEGDYLIFGHFHGLCGGEECVEIFKIFDEKLYEDTNDNYALNDFDFDFESVDDEKYLLVADLMSELPSELLASPDSTFGCPDCADQGGIYIQYKNGDNKGEWRIDKVKAGLPDYLHDFVDLINDKIEEINS